jgi:ABC-2 type transport system ATP-binding protein
MTSSPLLRLSGVRRILAGREVVTGLNLSLDRGSVLGLLGVNGAGKSTALRMMAGVLSPSAGQVLIDGRDLAEHPQTARTRLGYLPEHVPLYPELRVDEYLAFCARLHGLAGPALVRATAAATERCALGNVRRRLLGNLSKGYQQRVGVAQALVHNPALIVLDEPTSGLDPVQAASIRALIAELRGGHAVILSTHLLPDVQACCDRVAILHGGRLRHEGPTQALVGSGTLRVRVHAALEAAAWSALELVQRADRADPFWRIELTARASAAQLAQEIVARGWGLLELRGEEPSLEQTFLRIASADDTREAA